jgi:hypothetical protein
MTDPQPFHEFGFFVIRVKQVILHVNLNFAQPIGDLCREYED